MPPKRPVSWFLTGQGRKTSFALVTGTGIALTIAKYGPHTFFLNRYKDFVHYYRNGQPEELPAELKARCEKCLDIIKLSDVHKKIISPFSVYGYDLFHAGSTSSKFGALVGLPVNFKYQSTSDIENDDVQVNQKRVDWSSEVGKKLANALLLPEKVQQFAICREILMTHNNKVMFESTYPFMTIFMCYNLSQYLNKRLNLYAAPTMIRGMLYSIISLFGVGTYFLFKDMTEVYYEVEVDKKLCKLDPEFAECGVIFYDKILQRNQALRELMGSEGEKKYSKLGNENFVLRQPRISIVHRKSFFENKVQENKTANEETSQPGQE